MSNNNFYNILNSFNKVAQEPQQPAATKQTKATTKLQESMEQVLSRKLIAEKKSKPDFLDMDKDGNKKEPMKKAAKDSKKQVQEKAVSKAQQKFMGMVHAAKKGEKAASPEVAKAAKGMSKKAAKDFASTKHKGLPQHVKEAIIAAFEAGMTKDQIIEGWDEMMKSVKDRDHSMKTGEKRQGAKGEIEKTSTGVKHTRRYDPKTGETETGSNGEQVKRGRGRPKKSNFENKHSAVNKLIKESIGPLVEGRIEGGVWVDKPGNVPVPQNPEVAAPTKPGTAAVAPKTGISGQAAQDLMKSSNPNIYNKLTGQKTPAKLTPAVTDPEVAKEGDEPNFKSALGRAAGQTAGIMHAVPRAAYGAVTGDTGGTKMQAKTADGPVNAFKQGWDETNPYNLKKAFGDKEGVKEDDMEEGNAFSGAVAKAKADGIQKGEKITVGGKEYPVKEDSEDAELEESLNQMRRIAGLPVVEAKDKKAKKDYDGDGKVESGKDEYLGSKIAAAKKAGKLKEGKCSDCGKDPCACKEEKCNECGMWESKCSCSKDKVDECMSPLGGAAQEMQDSQGKMNISTNMSSDGNKSVTITADGEAAAELMQMLKLAGMGGGEQAAQDGPEGVMVVAHGGEEDEVDENLVAKNTQTGQQWTLDGGPKTPVDPNATPMPEAKDERYHANTTPEEHVMPTQVQTKGGDGDVAGKEKKMSKHGYQFGDNPQAMRENATLKLMKEYEAIKVKK